MTDRAGISGDLSERIRQASARLGEGGRSVAELVLAHPEEVALLPAAQVAARLGLSESTVVRFAATIGYDGYPALRRALQERMRRHLAPAERLAQYAEDRSRRTPAAQSFADDRADVAATERDLAPADLAAAVRLIAAARRTYIVGLRSSFVVAYTLYHHLNPTLGTVRLVDPARGEALDRLASLRPADALVAIAFPRYTRLTVRAAAFAAAEGAKVIAVTDGPLSPLARHATVLLAARSSNQNFANSNVGALALANALIAEITVRNRRRAVPALARLEQVLGVGEVLAEDAD
ncbi:MAG: MurR/RpiR family transcriptional regulator [Alphaproteobacteria bacterium]|nr:MurR/RpiR family transcriptional regulator [Alphaproteobacteria bacterium]